MIRLWILGMIFYLASLVGFNEPVAWRIVISLFIVALIIDIVGAVILAVFKSKSQDKLEDAFLDLRKTLTKVKSVKTLDTSEKMAKIKNEPT